MTNIIPTCIERHWSEGSTNTLVEEFGSDDKRADLAMAILEGCSVADAGHTFCQGCYTLEGDSPLISTAKEALERIMAQFTQDTPFVRVERIVDRVVDLILQQGKDNAAINKNDIQAELDASNEMVNEGQCNLDAAKLDEDSTKGVRAGTNGRRRPARYLNTDDVARAKARVAEAKDKLKKLRMTEQLFRRN